MDISLDDVKTHLNIVSARDDAELQRFLDAAVGMVEPMLTGPLTPVAVTDVFVAAPQLCLSKAPVATITAVTMLAGSWLLTYPADFLVDLDAGIITVTPFMTGLGPLGRPSGTVQVDYMAGWATTPAAVRLAVLVVVAHLWETQRGTSALPQPGFDQVPSMAGGAGFAFPNRAKELLAPYVRGQRV